MRLRFQVQAQFVLKDGAAAELDPVAEFHHDSLLCQIRLVGGDPVQVAEGDLPEGEMPDGEALWFRWVNALTITVDDQDSTIDLDALCRSEDHTALAELLTEIANRCLRAIRNFGWVSNLSQIDLEAEGDYQQTLRSYQPSLHEGQIEGERWNPLFPEYNPVFAALLGARETHQIDELSSRRWRQIREAIEEDREPPPEHEFTANAMEHLRSRNARYAVLESIIGLEIVMARFLRTYLRRQKGISKSQVNENLTPDIGITARLNLLLEMAFTSGDKMKYDRARVQGTITLRNRIVHQGVDPLQDHALDEIREGIVEVLGLIHLLADKARRLELSPEMRELAEEFSESYPDAPNLSLTPWGEHRLLAVFSMPVLTGPEDLEPAILLPLVELLIPLLEERDNRFNAEDHLTVRFVTYFPQEILAEWSEGELSVLITG